MKLSPMPQRRSQLARSAIRRTELVRRDLQATRKAQQPSRRLAASTRELATARRVVLERDGGRCWVCGASAGVVHHRLPRGAGGSSRNPDIHCPTNLITVCDRDHVYIETHRTWGIALGLLVSRGHSPADIPVCRCGVSWWRLFTDGRMLEVAGDTDSDEAERFVDGA